MPEWAIQGCVSQEVIPFATLTLKLVITFFWTRWLFYCSLVLSSKGKRSRRATPPRGVILYSCETGARKGGANTVHVRTPSTSFSFGPSRPFPYECLPYVMLVILQ